MAARNVRATSSALACAACGHARVLPPPTADAQAQALHEQDYLGALRRLAAREPSLEARVVDCPGCGAQTRFEGHVLGDRCAFCATPLLLDQARIVEGEPLPDPVAFARRMASVMEGSVG